MSEEKELRIKQDYLQIRAPSSTIDQIRITTYLGTYANSVVLMITQPMGGTGLMWSETVAGYEFGRFSPWERMLVWNDGKFYTLSANNPSHFWISDAFGLGLLSEQNIAEIWHHFQK